MGRVIAFDPSRKAILASTESEKPEELLWICVNCESETLYCYTDGRIECSQCGELIHDLRTFEP